MKRKKQVTINVIECDQCHDEIIDIYEGSSYRTIPIIRYNLGHYIGHKLDFCNKVCETLWEEVH